MEIVFDSPDQLIPVVIQDILTHKVLMHAYTNEASYSASINLQRVIAYEPGKKRPVRAALKYKIIDKYFASDHSYILLIVDNQNVKIDNNKGGNSNHSPFNQNFIFQLAGIIDLRYNNPQEGSYVNDLRKSGLNKIAQKVIEEAGEAIIAAINDTEEEFIGETADLLFHLLVLLREKQVSLSKIADKLLERHLDYQDKGQ